MEAIIENKCKTTVGGNGRLWLLVRKMLIENRKTLMILCGGYLGSFAVIGFWAGLNGIGSSAQSALMYAVFASLVCMVSASLMFHDFGTKGGRINDLMTPAGQSCKFLVRLVAVFPGSVLLVMTGYYVLSGCMNLALGLSGSGWFPVFNPFSLISEDYILINYIFFVSTFLFNEGMFIFGAIAWPRKSFLKTLLVQVGLGMLMSFAGIMVTAISMNYTIVVHNWKVLGFIAASAVSALGIGLIYTSYRLFRRKTVIN